MRWVHPHHVARSIHDVDYEALLREGVQAIVYDLENTLCRWRTWELDPPAWALLDRLAKQEVRLAVLTNASLPTSHPLAQAFQTRGIVLVTSARKPLRRGFQAALARLCVPPQRAAMVGDQLLTDVLGGRRAGMLTVLVEPLDAEESMFTKLNRRIEHLLGRPAPQRAPRSKR